MTSLPWLVLPQFTKKRHIVECGHIVHEFDTYREAEIFCGERGISCENIYEVGAE